MTADDTFLLLVSLTDRLLDQISKLKDWKDAVHRIGIEASVISALAATRYELRTRGIGTDAIETLIEQHVSWSLDHLQVIEHVIGSDPITAQRKLARYDEGLTILKMYDYMDRGWSDVRIISELVGLGIDHDDAESALKGARDYRLPELTDPVMFSQECRDEIENMYYDDFDTDEITLSIARKFELHPEHAQRLVDRVLFKLTTLGPE